MKKFRKVLTIVLALTTLLSVCCISASAETQNVLDGYTIVDGMIDRTIYGDDIVYIQEHADRVAQMNETKLTRATTYTPWDWSRGIYSVTGRNATGIDIGYSFTPVSSRLYFNARVEGDGCAPGVVLCTLNSNGSTTYVGTYMISYNSSEGAYVWDNYSRPVNSGTPYTVSIWATNGSYTSLELDIYKSAI